MFGGLLRRRARRKAVESGRLIESHQSGMNARPGGLFSEDCGFGGQHVLPAGLCCGLAADFMGEAQEDFVMAEF